MTVESERKRLRARTERPGDKLPVNSYAAAAPWLRRPFTPEAVSFRVVEAWADTPDGRPTSDKPLTHATVVPYITARAVFARLNLVCPALWSMGKPEAIGGQWWTPIRMRHGKGVDTYVEQWDLSDDYSGKARVSDAIKRVAVHFGVGESVYAVPPVELTTTHRNECRADLGDGLRTLVTELPSGYLRPWSFDGEPWLTLTRAGEEHCRNIYRRWLLKHGGGIHSFGKPLDHGNLTMLGEAEGEGPPMPVTRPGEKTQGKGRADRPRPPKVPPQPQTVGTPTSVDPETELAKLLGATPTDPKALKLLLLQRDVDHKLHGRGDGPAERLKAIRDAGNARGLAALLTNLARDAKVASEDEEDAAP